MIRPGQGGVTIQPVRTVADLRGLVLEPLTEHELPLQRNVHLVLTEPGQVRGNHYHKRGHEITVAIGPGLFRYRDGAEVRDAEIPAGVAYRISIAPGVAHAIQNTGSSPMVLIGFNTEAHDPASPDTVRDVLIEPAQSRSP